ncbi:MAG: phosphonate C-P lyase system protein PhnG [Pseudomonadota bacterium]
MTATITTEGQQRIMGILAHAKAGDLAEKFAHLADVPEWQFIRRPETGLVMVRGRIAAEGASFNFGEATVTRAVVALDSGETGFAYALGRDQQKAERSAIVHALWKRQDFRDAVETVVLQPLEQKLDEADDKTRGEVAATKVDFFTLMRGDD